MKTRSLSKLVLVVTILCCAISASAQSRFTYDGGYAATYARNNAWMEYGSGYNQNPFHKFVNNCAHFVSQAIVAGMVRKTNPWEVYDRRYDFQADLRTDVRFPRWFYIGSRAYERGPAWTGAKEMHKYADWNKSTYKGLHFKHIVSDTPSKRSLTTSNVLPGDVIFCDWQDDNIIDHVVIVSSVDKSRLPLNSYKKIKIASQSNNHADTALQWILDKNYQDNKTWASFRVYRPLDYNNAGL